MAHNRFSKWGLIKAMAAILGLILGLGLILFMRPLLQVIADMSSDAVQQTVAPSARQAQHGSHQSEERSHE